MWRVPQEPGRGSFAAPAASELCCSCAPRHVWNPAVSFWMWCLIFYPISCSRLSPLGLGSVCTPGDASDPQPGQGRGARQGVRRRLSQALCWRPQSKRLSSPTAAPSLPPPASRPPGSPGLWPRPSVSASVLTRPPTPRSLLSHQEARWISSSPGSPSAVPSPDPRGVASANTRIGLPPIAASGARALSGSAAPPTTAPPSIFLRTSR